jgi:hypothetical protein
MPEIKMLSLKEKAKEQNRTYITILRWIKQNRISWVKIEDKKRKWFFPGFIEESLDQIEELKKL